LEESQLIFRAANDKKGIALTNWHLAWILEDEGNQTAGLELTRQALTLLEELGDVHRQSILLRTIGWMLLDTGELKQGSTMLRRALSAAFKVGSKFELGNTFMDLALAESNRVTLRNLQFLWAAQKLFLACGAKDYVPDLNRLMTACSHRSTYFRVSLEQAQGWTMEQAIAHAPKIRLLITDEHINRVHLFGEWLAKTVGKGWMLYRLAVSPCR
jgi:hypothetical protein